MKQDNINYLAVGAFVLTMFIVLLVVLFRITGRGADTQSYYTLMTNITGIRAGSAVTFSGYQVGYVDDIEPRRQDGHTLYRIELDVRSKWKVPEDSVVRIVQPGLLAENQLDILEGRSAAMLPPGGTIQSEEAMTMMAVFQSMTGELKPLLAQVNTTLTRIGGDLDAKLPNITSAIESLLAKLNRQADQLQKLTGGENQQRIMSIIKNTDTMTHNLARLSTDFGATSRELEQLLANSNRLISDNHHDIRQSVVELRASLDAVSENINSIVYNMDAASRNMNEFTRELRSNPGALLGGKAPQDKAGIQP